MQFNKIILLIVLSISSYGFIIAMLEGIQIAETAEKKYVFLIPTSHKNEALYLAQFARENNTDTVTALKVARWLVLQRKDIVEDQQWTEFINMFVFHLSGHHCLGQDIKNKKLDAVVGVVKEIAYGFKTGEDNAQLLVDRAVEALNKIGQ